MNSRRLNMKRKVYRHLSEIKNEFFPNIPLEELEKEPNNKQLVDYIREAIKSDKVQGK